MRAVSSCHLLAVLYDAQFVRYVVWGGLVALTVCLLVLMRTRWGQSHPLRKCIVLSLLAHLLLGIYTTTVNIVAEGAGPGDGAPLRVSLVTSGADDADDDDDADAGPQSWEQLTATPLDELAARFPTAGAVPLPADAAGSEAEPRRRSGEAAALPAAIDGHPPHAAPQTAHSGAKPAAAIEAPAASRVDAAPLAPQAGPRDSTEAADAPPRRIATLAPEAGPLEMLAPRSDAGDELHPGGSAARKQPLPLDGSDPPERTPPGAAGDRGAASPLATDVGPPDAEATSLDAVPPNAVSPNAVSLGAVPTPGPPAPGDPAGGAEAALSGSDAKEAKPVPSIYQLRVAPDHTRQALAHGGTRETEAAVVAALAWLATHQSADGRWDGGRLEAGRESAVDGHERRGAGTRADTGITGLSLLALFASGHTQLAGEHRETARRGLEFLLRSQAADGNLGGDATLYEKMYCHAMASFALSEAYAMTHDARLQTAVRRAIGYSLAAQHHTSGGWRYQPGEAGDMSQMGWQFMALKSAELAGIPVPAETRAAMVRFLASVSSGPSGGLAAYRPGHRPTRTMTAEALVCRQFLGMPRANPAAGEAGNFLLQELPGEGQANFYYWYYATLGMYQLQDEHWKRWNAALQTTLVSSQRVQGDRAGSWDPDPVWGAYGGRAYSTALGALCLEVYYRFLPFYVEAAGRDRKQK